MLRFPLMRWKKAFLICLSILQSGREVRIVERCIADVIGAGIDIRQTPGSAIVNLGGETTDIAILSRGGIVLNRLLKTGGAFLDQMVVTMVRRNLDFVIGEF
ncbi:MAG: rod shape-determining protein [Sellimonas intestinalis]